MTIKEMYELLCTTGYPVRYQVFPETEAPTLPFITYQIAFSNNISADNRVRRKVDHYQIQLWTRNKDQVAEGKVETALDDFFWNKTETYVDDEEVFRVVYEMEVTNG